MYINDSTSDCTIYNRSFLSDLYPYSLDLKGSKEDNTLQIHYSNNDESGYLIGTVDVTFDFSSLSSNILSSSSIGLPTDDCWFPVLINSATSAVYSKEILRGSSIRRRVLGIENFLSFPPLMQNWTTLGNPSMCSDWFINLNLISDDPDYGLLVWAKKNSIKNNLLNTIDKFPIGTRLKASKTMRYTDGTRDVTIDPDDFLIKINNNILKILNRDDSIFKSVRFSTAIDGKEFKFSEEDHVFNLDTYSSYASRNKIEISKNFKLDCHDVLPVPLQNYTLWIPDGECYSFRTKDDLIKKMPGDAYLSAGLFHYYRSIYHRLTNNIIKTKTGMAPQSARRLKVLSYYLATSPLIDRVSVDYLLTKNIQDIILRYMGSSVESSIDDERKNLIVVLTRILQEYRALTYNLDNKTTLASNIIRNKKDLFTKITTKYGAFIQYTSPGELVYKNVLPNGPHCMINRLMKTHCNKGLNNSLVYNNEIIRCGNINIHTDIRNDRSEMFISGGRDKQIIPFADIDRTQVSIESEICAGPDRIIKASEYTVAGEIRYKELEVSVDNDLFRSSLKWELIDGPSCLRFSDLTVDRSGTSRFKTSSDGSPTIYAKKIGAYTLKVTATTEFFSGSDTITLYIVDDKGEYAPGKTPQLLDTVPCEKRESITVGDNLKCMCPNLRSFAINKRGMFWPIQSDLYVKYMNNIMTGDFDDLGVMRFDSFHRYPFPVSSVSSNDASLSFRFIPENTRISLYEISLMNMRDGNKHTQCQSFYEDLLVEMATKPPSLDGIYTGASKYVRSRRAPDTIDLERIIINPDGSKTKENIQFAYPNVTMKNSPDVLSYGGYDSDVIRNLGINIPDHISPGARIRKLPPLQTYNDMSEPKDIRCFLEDVPISRTANLLCDKGYFHPQKGWIPSSNSLDEYIKSFTYDEPLNSYSSYYNKTSVIKFKPETHKSLLFKGAGFLNLRASSSDASTNVQTSAISFTKSQETPVNHNTTYGYTNPNGFASFDTGYTDEYIYDDGGDTTTYNCDQDTNVTYFLPNIDNLTIKDVEVKVNFLNYPNPKNLVLWLEVYSPTMYTYATPLLSSFSTTYQTQLAELNKENLPPNTRKIYLLNQESIDHYHHNISLWFTDGASTSNTTFDTNKMLPSGIRHDQKMVGSECYKLRPTLMANGYNDKTAAQQINRIKSSKRYYPEYSMAKFKGIRLKDAVFTLKAMVVNHTDMISSGDTLVNNGELSGFVREKTKLVSNIDINSLCNWELIIHTDKVKYPVPSESIGLLDRSLIGGPKKYDGYNYIINVKNKGYLIPQINFNAPYNYLSTINPCKYYDNTLSQSMSWRTPTFPSWAIIYIMTFGGFTGFTGGGVLGIQTGDATAGYSHLFQYFTNISLAKRESDINDKTRIPSYSRYPFGSPDKVLLEISTDQKFWYKTEVPFFKYSNSKVLENKEYGYIKLSALKNFYTFEYEVFNPTKINNFDTVNTTDFNRTSLDSTFAVKGKRLFYLLPKDKLNQLKIDGVIRDIVNQQIVYNNSEYYTVFDTSNRIAPKGSLTVVFVAPEPPKVPGSPMQARIAPGSETILIYDKKYTMIDQQIKKHNQWGLQKNQNDNISVSRIFNTLGEGSYGRGTDALKETTLSDITESYNDLGNIIEIYDDDKYHNLTMKKNSIYLSDENRTIEFTEGDKIYGYAFSENDTSDFISWANKNVLGYEYTQPEDRPALRAFLETLDQETSKDQNNSSSIFFDRNSVPSMIQLRSSKFTDLPATGTIKIENVFEAKTYKQAFNANDQTAITSRIDFLQNSNRTTISLSSNPLELSILELEKYINLLPRDSESCYANNTSSFCPKKRAKKILSARYDELLNLKYHMDETNVAESGLVPKIKRTVKVDNDNDGGSISITEEDNDEYYWFSLTKDHKLSPADNANPKVLKKSFYKCVPIAGNALIGFDHLIDINQTELKIPEDIILAKKREYNFVSEWVEVTQSRFLFFPELDLLKEMLVTIEDTYYVPKQAYDARIITAEQLLENADNIYIRFRNIPRKFKEIDSYYDTYRPNRLGQPIRQLGLFTTGETLNNFVCWRCTTDNDRQNYVPTPPFYQQMNEMIFRSFYGSVDGIEHKNVVTAKSKEPWEWIPYEYF